MPNENYAITQHDPNGPVYDGPSDTERIARNHAQEDYSHVTEPHKFIRMIQEDLKDVLKILDDERKMVKVNGVD